jgi:hypothetical protein
VNVIIRDLVELGDAIGSLKWLDAEVLIKNLDVHSMQMALSHYGTDRPPPWIPRIRRKLYIDLGELIQRE